MAYELEEVIYILKTYNEIESKARDFLFISASALKNKDYLITSAHATLKAMEEYKKLPLELRKKLESDKNNQVSRIIELEKLCLVVITKNKI